MFGSPSRYKRLMLLRFFVEKILYCFAGFMQLKQKKFFHDEATLFEQQKEIRLCQF